MSYDKLNLTFMLLSNGIYQMSWGKEIQCKACQASHCRCSPTRLINSMKKVNKQCLLDTPRTVRVSEKTWQVIVQNSIVSAKYQIVPSKAVVGVDQPIKAPSTHIQKPY